MLWFEEEYDNPGKQHEGHDPEQQGYSRQQEQLHNAVFLLLEFDGEQLKPVLQQRSRSAKNCFHRLKAAARSMFTGCHLREAMMPTRTPRPKATPSEV